MILTVFLSFIMFVITLLLGLAIGYSMGHKADHTLKQQISKLKTTIKSQNESAQLKELTAKELQERKDWDFRSRLAEITGAPVIQPDSPVNDDPQSMERTF